MRKLRRPCEHDRYDAHEAELTQDPIDKHFYWPPDCPGGEFLPEDAKAGDLIWANTVTYDRRIYLDDGTELEAGRYLFVPLVAESE